ncbi:glycosyltransferase [Rhodanobacter geophilus]|uniref:Glycosyltransferase n=1 Tax=Rhodanobacter geophilus TaxID=3162488 RepID=A0ABV3QQD9_9GAMM
MSVRPNLNSNKAVVLIACNRDSPSLQRTLESVRGDSSEIAIVIVDDGSATSLEHYASDPNVEVVRLDSNKGLTRALNVGLKRIQALGYGFICRIDAGDENISGRLQEQLDYLRDHPDLWLVGSWADYVDVQTGRRLFLYQPPTTITEVNRFLHRNSCIAHPAWMVRTALFAEIGLYDESFAVAQDYEFLRRAIATGHSVCNVPKVLLKYQVDPAGISLSRRRQQLLARLRVQWRYRHPLTLSKMIGVGMTLALLAIPYRFVHALKRRGHA